MTKYIARIGKADDYKHPQSRHNRKAQWIDNNATEDAYQDGGAEDAKGREEECFALTYRANFAVLVADIAPKA